MSPAFTDLSLGIDWKPNEIFSLYLSPAAGRIVTALDSMHRSRYGVDADKTLRGNFGLSFKGTVQYAKIENFKVLYSP